MIANCAESLPIESIEFFNSTKYSTSVRRMSNDAARWQDSSFEPIQQRMLANCAN